MGMYFEAAMIIITLVLLHKTLIQKITVQMITIFVPNAITIACLSLIFWSFMVWRQNYFGYALINAVTVLAISCSCALSLVSPIAQMAGMGQVAQNRIIIKNGVELEIACRIKTVVLDKTGTITTGKMGVTSVVPVGLGQTFLDGYLIRMAAIAEKKSEHPLGSAIYKYGNEIEGAPLPDPEEFKVIPGRGVSARIDGKVVLIGSERLMRESYISIEENEECLSKLRDDGNTVVIVAIEGELVGFIGF